ncbi:reverse transcriptase domain-containing protein [Tanacetum coccineum]
MCPMTRGGYEAPVYHDNFQQFQQTASVGNFVKMEIPEGTSSNLATILTHWFSFKPRSPISPEPSSAQVNNSPLSKESSKETKLPYPSRVEREKKDSNDKVQIQKFWEMFKKIHVDITLADALILMPKYQKMLKSLLTNKDKLIEIAKTPMNANCSAVILKKLPEKLGDPGRFLIPCGFGEFDKHLALADLGASINLMPLSILENNFGIPDLHTVGKFYFPVDFVILDFVADPRVPLILGRPFLRTARVLIDVHGEELVIRDGLERIVFKPDGSQDNESIHMMDAYDDRDEEIISNEASSITSPKIDVKTIMSFFAPIGNCVRKWASSEVEKDNVEGKIFDPGITFHGNFFEKEDKSSKELAPSKALLTLDVFDLSHTTRNGTLWCCDFCLVFGFWKLHGSILWKDKAIPTVSIDGLQSSLHKMGKL